MIKTAILSFLFLFSATLAEYRIKELTREGNYGKSVANMIELHLDQNPEQFDGAMQLIAQVRTQLQGDMISDETQYLAQASALRNDIAQVENDADVQSTQLKATNKFISEVSAELVSLIQTANSLTKQLDVLNGREEEIRENRGQEQLVYNKRTKNSNKVVGALRTILKTLSEAVLDPKNNVFAEQKADQLIDHLKEELGESDPLISMVELAKDFDTDVVREIIHKLEFLESDVEEILKEDERQEKAAIDVFTALIYEIGDIRRRFTSDLSTVRNIIAKRNQEKVIAEKRRDQLDIDFPLTQQLLVSLRNKSDQLKVSFENRQVERSAQIKVIEQAIDTLRKYITRQRSQPAA